VVPVITAATGFLIAVLWFDLMFDVQVWRHRRSPEVPEDALGSIAAYYRRVTTEASPMGRLVGLVMVVLLVALVVQAIWGDEPLWVSFVSIPAALVGIGFAAARIFRDARRLGTRRDTLAVQSDLARGIFGAHLVCLAAMWTLLVVQLVGAGLT
jgi:hypothetical protein